MDKSEETLRYVTSEELVRTYSPASGIDPWELVQQYHRVLDYKAGHPQLGSSAISSRLDLPRGRVRSRIEGDSPSVPDCLRGLQTAEKKGWINMNPETDTFRGFNILMASVFSGGTISNDLWEPRFAVDDAEAVDRVATALRWVDVEYEVIRSTEQSRATEIRPKSRATLVGRILYCLGAPTGPAVGG